MIFEFRKLKKFVGHIPTVDDLAQVLRLSTVVDIDTRQNKLGDIEHVIRKKKLAFKSQYTEFFGYNVETIKQLTKEQFEIFLSHKKKFEGQILENKPIIVTTVGMATTKGMANRKFKRVVIDEATMVKENEAFLASINAEQIVLVGDQKQLGPAYTFKVEGPTSLFSRLIQADHPYDFLNTQYRMHKSLMEVPNLLFYKN